MIAYNIVLGLAIAVAAVFTLMVLMSKGDAMSSGGGIRTSFKGKASFDDFLSRLTLILGGALMVLTLALDVIGHRLYNR